MDAGNCDCLEGLEDPEGNLEGSSFCSALDIDRIVNTSIWQCPKEGAVLEYMKSSFGFVVFQWHFTMLKFKDKSLHPNIVFAKLPKL